MNPKLTPERLSRKAIVYVRQSRPSQLIHHQESTRLQFSLVDRARAQGFQRIVVVDDDLGRSGSGWVDRPGFECLAAEVCTGDAGLYFVWRDRDWFATAARHLIRSDGAVRGDDTPDCLPNTGSLYIPHSHGPSSARQT